MESCSQCISDQYCRRQTCRWVPFRGSSLQPWECAVEGVIPLRSLRSMYIVFSLIIHCLQAAWSQLGEYGVFCQWKDIGRIRIHLNSWCWKHPASFSFSDQINIAGQWRSDPLKQTWGELMWERRPFTRWPTEVTYTVGFHWELPATGLHTVYIWVFIELIFSLKSPNESLCWNSLLWNMC